MRRLPFLLIVAALTSCAWINEHDPAQTPTADYPCTPSGIVCSTKPLTCCGQGDTCGGTFPSVGCPVDSCCYIGSDDARVVSPDAGTDRPMRVRGKQWTP